MRSALLTGFMCLAAISTQSAWAENGKGFQLTIDGKQTGINVGETVTVTTGDGKEVKVSLERSKFATASGALFSFDHPGDLNPAKTEISRGITQYFLTSATGTSVIVQEYDRSDADAIASRMIKGFTNDDRKAGAKIKETPTERKLESGKTLKGMKAVIGRKSTHLIREAFSTVNGNKGIVILTRFNEDNGPAEERAVIDMFWKSLKINL